MLSECRGGVQVFLRLPGRPDQVAYARRWISAELGRGHPLRDDALLLASEIATNAILHSRTGDGGTFTLDLSYSDSWVLLRVRDEGSADPPCACHAAQGATAGRGLPLVEALSLRWGVIREARTNEVWFELTSTPTPTRPPNGTPRPRSLHPHQA
jgi:anti-sigma regulatory factor (Ser/Thr protein kinase)